MGRATETREAEEGSMMLTSQLIAALQAELAEHGDLPIYIRADDYGFCDGVGYERNAGKRDTTFPVIVIESSGVITSAP